MGVIKKGILGGFSGKVGNVVGANWIGIDYMRAMPASVANPDTIAQREVRGTFRAITRFLLSYGIGNINVQFKPYRVKMSPFNAAWRYLYRHAITGSGDSVVIDFENFTPGNDNVIASLTTSAQGGNLSITYTLANTPSAEEVKALSPQLIIYNADKAECFSDIDTLPNYNQSSGTFQVTGVPAAWSGDNIHVYLFYMNADKTKLYQTAHIEATMV